MKVISSMNFGLKISMVTPSTKAAALLIQPKACPKALLPDFLPEPAKTATFIRDATINTIAVTVTTPEVVMLL